MQSRNFRLQRVGDLNWLEKHFHLQNISFSLDELIILNASRNTKSMDDFAKIIHHLTDDVFLPVAAGGGIRSIDDAEMLFNNGADKIVLNSILKNDADLVKALVNQYGSQSIIASIDYRKNNGVNEVFIFDGSLKVEMALNDYIKYVEDLNIGEIYLNSIDQDGTGFGYDIETINSLRQAIKVPLIIAGGAGNEQHLLAGLNINEVSAVATANLFNFLGNALPNAREKIIRSGANIAPWLMEPWLST